MANNSAEGIRWDLSDLFSAHDDPRIEAMLNSCRDRAKDFSRRFKSKISGPEGLTAKELQKKLKELEEIEETLSQATSYSGLLYAADSLRPEYQDLEQKVEQQMTEI